MEKKAIYILIFWQLDECRQSMVVTNRKERSNITQCKSFRNKIQETKNPFILNQNAKKVKSCLSETQEKRQQKYIF